jgi:hypothetical protein
MKTKLYIITVALLLVISASAVQAQTETQFEFTPFWGYQFGGEFVNRWDYEDTIQADIGESSVYGMFINIGVIEGFQIELMYSRQDTELVPLRLPPGDYPNLDLNVEYYHVGGLYQWKFDKVVPYVAGSMGATRFDPESFNSKTKFSVSAGGGVKLMFNPHIGVRFDGRFYSTYIDSNEEVFYDDYWGYWHTYRDRTFLHQFSAKGGLVLAF